MNARGAADRKVLRRWALFAIAIVLVLVAYIPLAQFGGRIPGNALLLPFLPIFLFGLVELVWQGRHGFPDYEKWPAWMRLTSVVAGLLCLAIVASLLVRYCLL